MRSLLLVLALALAAACGDDGAEVGEPQGTRLHQGLLWQLVPPTGPRIQQQAAEYCRALQLGGLGAWRLPTVSELRTLVHGCQGRQWGGSCQVADPQCLTKSCWTAKTCGHCKLKAGPDKGCYWEPEKWSGSCTETWFYWTSSVFDKFVDHYWVVRFQGGGMFDDGVVGFNAELGEGSVRCVRRP